MKYSVRTILVATSLCAIGIWFWLVWGRRTIFAADWTPEFPKIVLLVLTVAVLLRYKKLPEPFVILAAAIIGLILFPLVK